MKCFPSKTRHVTGAIRPLDVAAILCVLGVLAFLGVIATSHFKARALRVQCRGNLMKIGGALELYAGDNHGLLPDFSGDDPRYDRGGQTLLQVLPVSLLIPVLYFSTNRCIILMWRSRVVVLFGQIL